MKLVAIISAQLVGILKDTHPLEDSKEDSWIQPVQLGLDYF